MHLLQHVPQFSTARVLEIAREFYGLDGCTPSPLPSERDQNVLLTTKSGQRFVLKIANALESAAFLDAQFKCWNSSLSTSHSVRT